MRQRGKEKHNLFRARRTVGLTAQMKTFPYCLRNESILISNPHQVQRVRGDSASMNVICSYLKKGPWVMWSCVKMCGMSCYFKKTAWRTEIELSFFFRELCPSVEVISHTSHLLCSVAVVYFYHRYIPNDFSCQACEKSYFSLIFILRCC